MLVEMSSCSTIDTKNFNRYAFLVSFLTEDHADRMEFYLMSNGFWQDFLAADAKGMR